MLSFVISFDIKLSSLNDINDPHQDFKTYDDNNVFENAWTMDKIERKDGPVWVMNHFFVNPGV